MPPNLRLEMLTDIVNEVGAERFLAAVKKAIAMTNNRYDCTIRKIRTCAGPRDVQPTAPAYKAWQTVTEIVQKHVRRAPEGHWRLETCYVCCDAETSVTPVPVIPEPILRAVRCIGGWGAIATCPAEFWHQRMKDFVSVYEEE